MNVEHDNDKLEVIALDAIPDKSSDCRLVKARKQWKRDKLINEIKTYTMDIIVKSKDITVNG